MEGDIFLCLVSEVTMITGFCHVLCVDESLLLFEMLCHTNYRLVLHGIVCCVVGGCAGTALILAGITFHP